MFRDTSSMLAYEAKKRPALQTMLDRFSDVSEAEIEQAPFLRWIRQALLARKRELVSQQTSFQLLDWIEDGTVPDSLGHMHRWIGRESYVANILVQPNDLVWFPMTGGIWIETVFSKAFDAKIMASTRQEGLMLKSAYIAAYKRQKERLMPVSSTLTTLTIGGPIDTLAAYGVRIVR